MRTMMLVASNDDFSMNSPDEASSRPFADEAVIDCPSTRVYLETLNHILPV